MSNPETNPSNHPEHLDRPPIKRLYSDMAQVDNYVDLLISFGRYIEEEYPDEAISGNSFVTELIKQGNFPTSDEYATDRDAAYGKLQVIIYDYLIPLYETTHSQDELQKWVPEAISYAVAGNHEPEICAQSIGSDETMCIIGTCPLRHMRIDIQNQISSIDQDAKTGYFSVNHFLTLQQNISRRIEALEACKVITPIDSTKLWQRLILNCSRATNYTKAVEK